MSKLLVSAASLVTIGPSGRVILTLDPCRSGPENPGRAHPNLAQQKSGVPIGTPLF
jgi:hypothetical protein